MGQQRITPEFKDEGVRQVTKRGYSVQSVDGFRKALESG
jgi:hypothetical protein